MKDIVKMKDVKFDKDLFINYMSGTVLDRLLCSYQGLPKGVNYMIIGDPGVGKTTIILDMIANIQLRNSTIKILFISAEMNEIDLDIYVQRFPKFSELNILFVEADFNAESHCFKYIEETLQDGWDIIAIDSFYELQGIIKEEENLTLKKAESQLLSIIKKQNKAQNKRGVHTTFLTIQQVTKMDSYGGKQIRIYSQWSCAADLEEIAIHEYAHHIHATEWWRGEFKGKYDTMHGYNFWFIYNKLINLAFQKGYNINPKSYGIGTDFYNIYIRKFNQIDSNNF